MFLTQNLIYEIFVVVTDHISNLDFEKHDEFVLHTICIYLKIDFHNQTYEIIVAMIDYPSNMNNLLNIVPVLIIIITSTPYLCVILWIIGVLIIKSHKTHAPAASPAHGAAFWRV